MTPSAPPGHLPGFAREERKKQLMPHGRPGSPYWARARWRALMRSPTPPWPMSSWSTSRRATTHACVHCSKTAMSMRSTSACRARSTPLRDPRSRETASTSSARRRWRSASTRRGPMRDPARKAGRLLQVGLLMRSVCRLTAISRILYSNPVHDGRLLSLSTWRLGSYLRPDAPDHKSHYGDPTTELMTFDLDFASWLIGQAAVTDRFRAAGLQGGEVTALLDLSPMAVTPSIAAGGLMPAGMPFTAGFRALFENALASSLQADLRERPAARCLHGRRRRVAAAPGHAGRRQSLRDRAAPFRRLHCRPGRSAVARRRPRDRSLDPVARNPARPDAQRGGWRGIVTMNSVPGSWA